MYFRSRALAQTGRMTFFKLVINRVEGLGTQKSPLANMMALRVRELVVHAGGTDPPEYAACPPALFFILSLDENDTALPCILSFVVRFRCPRELLLRPVVKRLDRPTHTVAPAGTMAPPDLAAPSKMCCGGLVSIESCDSCGNTITRGMESCTCWGYFEKRNAGNRFRTNLMTNWWMNGFRMEQFKRNWLKTCNINCLQDKLDSLLLWVSSYLMVWVHSV